jgi:PAS domain S-box-containing protein
VVSAKDKNTRHLTREECFKRLTTLVLDSNDAITLLDTNGDILAWNKGAETIYGYTEDEALKMNIISIVPESERARFREMLDKLRRGEKIQSFMTKRVTKDGRILSVWLTITVLKDKDGVPCSISTIERDITHIEQVETELKDSNQALNAILEITTSAFRTLDFDKLVHFILNSLQAVMKADAAVILFHEGDIERIYAAVGIEHGRIKGETVPFGKGFAGTIAATKQPLYMEDVQQGSIIYGGEISRLGIRSMLGVPMVSDGNIVGVIHVDWITTHPFNEREQYILLSSAERCAMAITNSRLYEKTLDLKRQAELYLDVMGHDINNLNQIALTNIEFIMNANNLTEMQLAALSDTINAINSSANIIRNVRRIKEISAEKQAMLSEDINDMIIVCIQEAPKPEGRRVIVNYKPKKGLIVKGTTLMKEAFCNIINNAIKHSNKDITIDIDIKETMRADKKFYDISIADNGPGIPDDLKSKIFNRFRSGEAKVHGRGLGLFIVHSLVERAGGNVTMEDRVPGDYTKGAKFIISLPACEECK